MEIKYDIGTREERMEKEMAERVEEIPATVYKCKECGTISLWKSQLKICCRLKEQKERCEKCGKKISVYQTICNECWEEEMFNNAKKISYEEYKKEFPEYPIFYEEEGYNDIKELEEEMEKKGKEKPKYCYGAVKELVGIEIGNAIEEANDSLPEDDYLENTEEVENFIKKWNEKNAKEVYFENRNIAILIKEEK